MPNQEYTIDLIKMLILRASIITHKANDKGLGQRIKEIPSDKIKDLEIRSNICKIKYDLYL